VKRKAFSALPPAKVRFIEPMYARLVQSLPQGEEWLHEVKLDGYRCLVGKNGNSVTLWSRKETFLRSNSHKSPKRVNGFRPIHSLMGKSWL
jgi:hypothetical protein